MTGKRRYSGPIRPVEGPTRRGRTPYTDEENQWLLDLHAARPELGWRALSVQFYRRWSKDRAASGIMTFIQAHARPTEETP